MMLEFRRPMKLRRTWAVLAFWWVSLFCTAALAQSQPTPPAAAPFEEAFLSAANELFSEADVAGPVDLAIDPLVDGAGGGQSVTTRLMNRRLTELVAKSYPRFAVKPFSSATLANKPVVLIGTFTAINAAGKEGAPKDVYRIWLTLLDLKSGNIISKARTLARPDGVDPTPTAFFNDQPIHARDAAVETYINQCEKTKLGEPISAEYLNRLTAAALISDAIDAYNEGEYQRARDLYAAAEKVPGGDQLRVYNGLYLTNWKLNRREEAAAAFRKTVDFGLTNNRIAVRFLFRRGSASFAENRELATTYRFWLSEIGKRVAASPLCFETVGHTSPTGSEPRNQRLSKLRAQFVKEQFAQVEPALGARVTSLGVASRENLIGTGRDDASDALDRRVEIKVVSGACKG